MYYILINEKVEVFSLRISSIFFSYWPSISKKMFFSIWVFFNATKISPDKVITWSCVALLELLLVMWEQLLALLELLLP